MDDELARAYEFVLRADMFGTRVEPFSFGRAVFLPELPHRHDSNYLLVERPPDDLDAQALAAEAERVQGAAGLDHRCVMFRDGANGQRFAEGFATLGWEVFRGVVMVHRRAPERTVEAARAVRTDDSTLHAARTANILSYAWCTPEIARELLAARAYAPVDDEVWAVFEGAEPVSWAELYLEDEVAQVESVVTVPAYRRRGFASAVVSACVEEARRRGAQLVFLCADAMDWPRDLYRELGFDEIGRYAKFTRT